MLKPTVTHSESQWRHIKLVRAAEQRERHHSRDVGGARQEELEAEGKVLAFLNTVTMAPGTLRVSAS